MKGGHTSGPWMAASHPSSVSGLAVVARPSGRSIASVTFFHLGEGFENHDAESKANSLLIAAAPELLAALEEARGYVANVWEAGGDEFTRRNLDKIDTAIAKARGASCTCGDSAMVGNECKSCGARVEA